MRGLHYYLLRSGYGSFEQEGGYCALTKIPACLSWLTAGLKREECMGLGANTRWASPATLPITHSQIRPELCCHRLGGADRHHGSGRLRTAEAA